MSLNKFFNNVDTLSSLETSRKLLPLGRKTFIYKCLSGFQKTIYRDSRDESRKTKKGFESSTYRSFGFAFS